MPPPDKLTSLASTALSSLPGEPGGAEWRQAFRAVLTRAHTAAYIAGVAERAGVKPSEGLFKGMSKAERADVKRAVEGQLVYADKFAAEADGLSEAQVAARLQLYPGAAKATYGGARYPGLPFQPTEGSECMTNCRCSWQDNGDDTYTWVLDAKESCATCLQRADENPYSMEAA